MVKRKAINVVSAGNSTTQSRRLSAIVDPRLNTEEVPEDNSSLSANFLPQCNTLQRLTALKGSQANFKAQEGANRSVL